MSPIPQSLRIACRGSRLSLAQAGEVLHILTPEFPDSTTFTILPQDTPGDRDKHTPLTDPSVPDDFFTRDLDQALLRGEADLVVHSAKDLPKAQPNGLTVAALLPGKDPRDALVVRPGWQPGEQPPRIGTSSPRRTEEIEKLFPGAQIKALRGTIDERMAQLDRGDFDAILVAACAMERLGLAHRIERYLPYPTAPMQGRLALTTREDNEELLARLRPLDFRRRLFEESQPPVPISAASPSEPATLFVGTNPAAFARYAPLIPWPMIECRPTPRAERIAFLESLWPEVRGVLLASPFAVRCFIDALFHWQDGRALKGKLLLAAGPSTAYEIEQMGFHAAAAPTNFGGLDELVKLVDSRHAGRYLYPCSSAAPTNLRAATAAQAGLDLKPSRFYENHPRAPGPLPTPSFPRALFMSPSQVNAYFSAYPGETQSKREWLAVGPSTLDALRQLGLKGVLLDES